MANSIYRGPVTTEPLTVNRPVAGVYKPGLMVTASASALTQSAAGGLTNTHVLGNMAFKDQDTLTAYASGDTGVAYIPAPGMVFLAQMAAVTMAAGDDLTIDANGRLTNSVSAGNVVVAFFDGTAGAKSAGDLDDVIWANAYTKHA